MDRPLEEEWRNFELYEKIRIRDQRRRFWIIALTCLGFFSLCAVPVLETRALKWRTLDAARVLLVELEHLKTRAIQEKSPLRMRFEGNRFLVEVVKDCKSREVVRSEKEGVWVKDPAELKVLGGTELSNFSLKRGVAEICFDPVYGLEGARGSRVLVIAPVKDLAEERLERASYVILEGESAKISIN